MGNISRYNIQILIARISVAALINIHIVWRIMYRYKHMLQFLKDHHPAMKRTMLTAQICGVCCEEECSVCRVYCEEVCIARRCVLCVVYTVLTKYSTSKGTHASKLYMYCSFDWSYVIYAIIC